jgi:hypothetical protein
MSTAKLYKAVTLAILLQALIPSAVLSLLVGNLVCAPLAAFLILFDRLGAGLFASVRLAYVVFFVAGVLLQYNITLASIPFYASFVTIDSLPVPAEALLALALGACLFVAPIPRPKPTSNAIGLVATVAIGLIALKFSMAPNSSGLMSAIRSPELRGVQHTFSLLYAQLFDRLSDAEESDVVKRNSRTHKSAMQTFATMSPPPPKIMLMIVESWTESEASLKALVDDVSKSNIVVLDASLVPYSGGTLQAEIRELCGKHIELTVGAIGSVRFDDCLPARLSALGYATYAIHGYTSNYYLRSAVWPQMGFRNYEFLEQHPKGQICLGAYSGLCDNYVIHQAVKHLGMDGQRFSYVLTLQGHEPLSTYTKPTCNSYPIIGTETTPSQQLSRAAICELLGHSESLRRSGGAMLYIVGDHAAPSLVGNSSFPQNVVPRLVVQVN